MKPETQFELSRAEASLAYSPQDPARRERLIRAQAVASAERNTPREIRAARREDNTSDTRAQDVPF